MNKESVPEEKQFMCAVCFKTFANKWNTKCHILSEKHILHEPVNKLPENLPVTLPKNWKYGSCRFDINNSLLVIWIYDLHTKDDVVAWMKLYMTENKSKFICQQVRSIKTGKVIKYRCEHWKDCNRDHKRKKIKGTGCKCTIFFKLSRGLSNVNFSHLHHNHSLTSAAITSFHTPTEYVKRIFFEMFNNGVGPAEALNYYKNHLKNQNDTEYIKLSTDRSKTPSYDWVKYIYRTRWKRDSTITCEVMENIKRYIVSVNSETSEPICKYKEIDKSNFVAVVMTPLMERICNTKCAGELMFMDNMGSVNRFGLYVFLLMAKSNIGGIPMGILITSNKTVSVITEALSLFLEFITNTSFGGRANIGPLNVITEDYNSEIMALHNTFPASQYWLCTFHVLQCIYRWLWKTENGITSMERCDIYDQVKKMLYAENVETIENSFNYITLKYNNNVRLMKYITHLYQKKEKWCLYFRHGILIQDISANSIFERSIHASKENILSHINAQIQSPVQLLAYLIKEYSEFHSEKIISFFLKNNLTAKGNKQQTDSDYDVAEDEKSSGSFIVINKKTNAKYSVNLDVGMCTCYAGCSGACCKHQHFLNSRIDAFGNSLHSDLNGKAEVQLRYLPTNTSGKPLNSVLLQREQLRIEVVGELAQVYEDIPAISSPVFVSESVQTLKLQQEGKTEVRKFLKNCENLSQIMSANPAIYTSVLKSCNRHLTEMNNVHSKINPGLSLFCRTNNISPKDEVTLKFYTTQLQDIGNAEENEAQLRSPLYCKK